MTEPEQRHREVHEVASAGFEAEAAAYDRARPSYPPDAVAWLTANLAIRPGRRVVDLAAGTGKLTALLAGAGADLVAVEPVAAMRGRLHDRLPGVPLIAGAAESLPLAAASVDAVLVAQAFHWFNANLAMAELGRVLRVGGRVALIWNARERGVGWIDQIWSVMDRVERRAPWRDQPDDAGRPGTGGTARAMRSIAAYLAGAGRDSWSPWVEAAFSHVHVGTHDDVVDRIRSVSYVAALPPAEQQAVLGEVRAILREHPETRDSQRVGIPYRTDAMYAVRLR
jgi:SAM-dependent methyltransferase